MSIEPNNAVAYNNICSALNAQRKWGEAVAACEKALEINPNYQLAKNNLRWAKDELGKVKEGE